MLMKLKNKKHKMENEKKQEPELTQDPINDSPEQPQPTSEEIIASLNDKIEKQNNEYLLLAADFQNFRKRSLQEKQDLIKNGTRDALLRLLPVVDNFERALKSMADSNADPAQIEGVELIYNQLIKYLEGEAVKPIESTGKDFDTDFHEAVTTFPTDDDSLKGKVIDTVLTGYTINDKVLRHAKVVVGQ